MDIELILARWELVSEIEGLPEDNGIPGPLNRAARRAHALRRRLETFDKEHPEVAAQMDAWRNS
jgi:hypothetical protein